MPTLELDSAAAPFLPRLQMYQQLQHHFQVSTLKRALQTRKRQLLTCKRALQTHKSSLHTLTFFHMPLNTHARSFSNPQNLSFRYAHTLPHAPTNICPLAHSRPARRGLYFSLSFIARSCSPDFMLQQMAQQQQDAFGILTLIYNCFGVFICMI